MDDDDTDVEKRLRALAATTDSSGLDDCVELLPLLRSVYALALEDAADLAALEERAELQAELEHWKNRAETMNVDAGRRHVDNLALLDLVRDLYEALEDGGECSDERRYRLLTRARAVLR